MVMKSKYKKKNPKLPIESLWESQISNTSNLPQSRTRCSRDQAHHHDNVPMRQNITNYTLSSIFYDYYFYDYLFMNRTTSFILSALQVLHKQNYICVLHSTSEHNSSLVSPFTLDSQMLLIFKHPEDIK